MGSFDPGDINWSEAADGVDAITGSLSTLMDQFRTGKGGNVTETPPDLGSADDPIEIEVNPLDPRSWTPLGWCVAGGAALGIGYVVFRR